MARIDTSKIEGFESMTPEQQVKALTALEIPDEVDLTGYVSKGLFDKKAAEAAEMTRKYRATLDEGERKKADDDAEMQALRDELAAMKKDKTIADYTTKYIGLGYKPELASATAKALADGDMETVFKNSALHNEAVAKATREQLMNQTPKPDGAGGATGDGMADTAVNLAKELAKGRGGVNDSIGSEYEI